MKPLLIFDFDGTIVDTAPDIVRATQDFIRDLGATPPSSSDVRQAIGRGLKQLIHNLIPEQVKDLHSEQALTDQFIELYESYMFDSPLLFPGFARFIENYPGPTAILSNKRERHIHRLLSHLQIDQHPWTAIYGGDTASEMKPHPQPFHEILRINQLEADQAIMIGDGHPDVEGALNTGITCIAVEFGYSPIEELMELGAHHSLKHYDHLLNLISEIKK